ncbi:MAG: DUF2752 domain-containing protein [Chitinophagales bacterium]
MLPCAYKSLLGIDCPFCGAQRSLLFLLKGNIGDSLLMYPPLVPVFFCAILFSIHLVNKKIISGRSIRLVSAIVLGIIMINYGVKLVTTLIW